MTMNKLNIENIPIKYIIGTYKFSDDFPTEDDIIYMMTKRASDKSKSLDPVTFTTTVLYKTIDKKYHSKIEDKLNSLIKNNIIEKNRETPKGISYKIINNIFI